MQKVIIFFIVSNKFLSFNSANLKMTYLGLSE